MTGLSGKIHLSRSCFIWTKMIVLDSACICLALGTTRFKYLSGAFTTRVAFTHLLHSSPHTIASYKTAGGGVSFLPYNVLFCNILPFLLIPVCLFWMQIQETGNTHVSLISLITNRNKCSQRLFSTVISKSCTNLSSKNVTLLVNA